MIKTPEERLSALRNALADPDSPWYGSDLVPLVADLLDGYSDMRELALAYQSLCTAYRIQKQPASKTLDTIQRLNKILTP
jgi:hypothetical protein